MSIHCRSYGFGCINCNRSCIDSRGKCLDSIKIYDDRLSAVAKLAIEKENILSNLYKKYMDRLRYFKEHGGDEQYVYQNYFYKDMNDKEFKILWDNISIESYNKRITVKDIYNLFDCSVDISFNSIRQEDIKTDSEFMSYEVFSICVGDGFVRLDVITKSEEV